MRFSFAAIAFFSVSVVSPIGAQILAFGVKGGVRATNDESGFPPVSNESQRYIVGPAVQFRLPLGFAAEFNVLYRPFGYTQSFSNIAGLQTTRESAHSWEFPLIAKYRFSSAIAHPFVGIGYDPRVVSGTDFSSGPVLLSINPPVYQNVTGQTPTAYSGTHGLVVSGGFDLAAGHLQISPELRYVHWSQPFLNAQGGDGTFRIQSAQNEAFVLVGFMWRSKLR